MKNYLGLLLILLMTISGCDGQPQLKNQIFSDDINVTVEINQTKPYSENGINKSLLYGSLNLKRFKKNAGTLNLTCIAISVGDARSESIYIDNVAHVLPEKYIWNSDEKNLLVYWKMDKSINTRSITNKLVLNIKSDCNLFSKD